MSAGAFPPGWRIVPATAHGVHHILAGRENQDSLAYRRLGDGFVLAVADGAGSRARAALGSRVAVDAACDAAASALPGPVTSLPAFCSATRRFVQECLRRYDRRVAALSRTWPRTRRRDYASTLLAVVAHPPYFAHLNVGDGFLVVQHGQDGIQLVTAADPDDAAETTFLTTPGRAFDMRWGVIADAAVQGLALCTDGLAEGLLAVDTLASGRQAFVAPAELAAYFRIFADPAALAVELTRQLNSDDIAATTGDDRSMLLAVRR
jgi:hypothetical protein